MEPSDEELRQDVIRKIEGSNKAIDFTQIVTPSTRILGMGETHGLRPMLAELAKQIPNLKKAGITHIALEALCPETQSIVDAYQPGNDEIKQQLENHIKENFGWSPEAYVQLIDAAKNAGLEIIALNAKLENHRKDEPMANILKKVLADNSKNKVAAVAGSGHLADNSSNNLYRLLKESYTITNVDLIHPEHWETTDLVPNTLLPEAEDAIKASPLLRNKSFMFHHKTFNRSAPYEWVVYFGGE